MLLCLTQSVRKNFLYEADCWIRSYSSSNLLLVNLPLVVLLSILVITVHGGGVTTWEYVRMLSLFLAYPPITARTRNEGVRPYFVSPEVFKNR